MEDAAKGLFSSREFLDKWYNNYRKLEALDKEGTPLFNKPDEELERWANIQRNFRHMLPGELKEKLATLNFDFESKGDSWEAMHRQLSVFVEKHGHTTLPADQRHEALKDWLNRQILNKNLLSESQFQRLDNIGVDWEMPISKEHR